jgi:hypothetical protein
VTATLPEAPVLPDGFGQQVEPRDCVTCHGSHPAAIGHYGYRCLNCGSEYVNPELTWSTR